MIYTCNDDGRLAVRDAFDGTLMYRQRVGSGTRTYSASAVAATDRLYFCSERGEVTVVAAGKQFKKLASNELNATIMATPAIAGDRLFIRTVDHLICLKNAPPESAE